MRTDVPANIADGAHELSPDPIVTLYEVHLKNATIFYLSPTQEYTWQGNVYDEVPSKMTSFEQEADGRHGRPKFSFVNPGGIFTSAVYNGELDGATVKRRRILRADLEADNDFALTESLRVSKILTVTKDMITVELRDVMDGHNFILPARAYYPPEFPHVSLQ